MMTARLGSRLKVLLGDLGIGHPDNPTPTARETAPGGSWGDRTAATPITVLLEVEVVDRDALAAAGLQFVEGVAPILTGTLLPAEVLAVAEVPGVRTIDLPRENRLQLHTSVPATHADQVRVGALGLDGTGVIIGVVDTGIDIFHQAFRKPDGTTRLLSLLDTTAPYTITTAGGPRPNAGTFSLSWTPPDKDGSPQPKQTTGNLPFDATVQQVQAALVALPAFEPVDVLATGGPLPGTEILVVLAGQYLNKDVKPLVVNTHVTPSPAKVVIRRGREYSADDINAVLLRGAPVGTWDAVGHGTHCMGIAGGDGSQADGCNGSDYYIGVAPGADLIAVKTTLQDKENIDGVNHVFDRAAALNKPAVVNLSWGSEDGAHDGSAHDEREFDRLLINTPQGRAIVVAAGNDGALFDVTTPHRRRHRGDGLHTIANVGANASTTVDFVIGPDDKKDDYFHFWYEGPARLNLALQAPGRPGSPGPSTAVVHPDDPDYTTPLAGNGLQISSQTVVNFTNRHNIEVYISPPPGGVITAGLWRFTLTEIAGTATDFDCWIALDKVDAHPRFSNADQDRSRTLTTPSTAFNVITVADYNHTDNTLADTSGRGPTADSRPAGETKPDIAAPGEGITAARSFAYKTGVCCDCCRDFYITMSGTSMAAPHITGIVALMFQRNPTLTWFEVREALRQHADPPDPITQPTLPNADWGAGIVNALSAVGSVAAHAAATGPPVAVPTSPAPGDSEPVPFVAAGAAAMIARGPGAAWLKEIRRLVASTPAGQLVAALVSTHLSEVIRLVNHERRVTIAWHRMHGPDLLQDIVRQVEGGLTLPKTVNGQPVAPGLARLLDELERAGSSRLRSDIAQHRELLMSLPGLSVTD
jgi:subtilisin family serine protease